MAFERGKFGLEYDLRQKEEPSGGLGWVVAAIAFVALVSLAWTLIGRFRSNAEDAEIDIAAEEEPQKVETPPDTSSIILIDVNIFAYGTVNESAHTLDPA